MKILFQGDSITDAGRAREDGTYGFGLGIGYPLLVASELGFESPAKHEFVNKGISGNRVVDIYARIKKDVINLAPDVMSILVGVNDVWHDFNDAKNGVDSEKYFRIYSMLIEEVKEALPDIKIIILEPFVLKASCTEEKWGIFRSEVEKRANMAKRIADKFNLPFVPLQEGFDKLTEKAEPSYWLGDGVHPTSAGHEYIKNEWIKAFKAL